MFAEMGTIMPSGVIVQWRGTIATIPSGFVLCDGNNNTPDLRDVMIAGAYQDDAGVAKTTIAGPLLQSGGNRTHTHGVGTLTNAANVSVGQGDASPEEGEDVAALNHTHTISGSTSTGTHIPTFYALAYIMKT